MAGVALQKKVDDRPPRSRRRENLERAGYFVASFAILLCFWEVGRATRLVNPQIFPSIGAVLKSGVEMTRNGSLQVHMYASFLRVLCGFSLGIGMAIVLGFLIGWFRVVRMLMDPAINFFRALPPIALIPLMIIFFGIGETSKIIVLTYASFFPALVVIYQALVGLDPIFVRAARSLGASNAEIFRKIVLPQGLFKELDRVSLCVDEIHQTKKRGHGEALVAIEPEPIRVSCLLDESAHEGEKALIFFKIPAHLCLEYPEASSRSIGYPLRKRCFVRHERYRYISLQLPQPGAEEGVF